MSIEEKVINKVSQSVSKKLDKALNPKEDLDKYIKRTMHGKLTKKVIKKKLKKEDNYQEEDITNEQLKGLGYKENKESIFQIYDIVLFLSIVVVIMSITSLTSNASFSMLLLAGVILALFMYALIIPLKFHYRRDGIYEPTDVEKVIMDYNSVYLYNNHYVRNYEIKNYEFIDAYLKDNKVKYIGFDIDENAKISKPLTYNEILIYQEMYEKEKDKPTIEESEIPEVDVKSTGSNEYDYEINKESIEESKNQ